MPHRPITLELTSGEQVNGLLVANEGAVYLLRVDDRSVAIHDADVVQVLYQGGPTTQVDPLAADGADEAARGPLVVEPAPAGDPSALATALLAAERRVVALLDGARATDLAGWLATDEAPAHVCLFDGLTGDDAASAPYLVELKPGPFFDWLCKGLGDHWGLAVETPCALPALAKHLRSFARVVQPSGREVHFRFYDPRVLRPWLTTLNRYDVATLFGSAWTGVPGGANEACCPLCDDALPPLRAAWCGACEAALGGDASAPFLIEALLVLGEDGAELLRHRPWPAAPTADGERPPQRRPFQRPRRGAPKRSLRDEQVGVIEAGYRNRVFEAWYLARLERTMPDRFAAIGSERALTRIRAGRARARDYGLVDDAHAATFLDVSFLWHPKFDLHVHGPYRPVLLDPELLPGEKAEEIWELAKAANEQYRRAQGIPIPADDEEDAPLLE